MRNVLIFYGSYGGGHLSAAKAIYNFIVDNYPECHVDMVDCVEYINHYINKLTTTAYSKIATKVPWAWGKVYFNADKGALSKISTTSNKVMSKKLNKLLKLSNPDLVISTHPFSSSMCCYLKKKGRLDCKVATVMTDYASHSQWLNDFKYTDYFLVAHDGMKLELEEFGVDSNKIFVTGIPISVRFSEEFNKNEVFASVNLDANKHTALFFAGGEYGFGKNKTCEVFECLIKYFPDLQVIAIAGKNEKIKKEFNELVSKYNRENMVEILGFTDKIPELMSVSDFVITKARWSYNY